MRTSWWAAAVVLTASSGLRAEEASADERGADGVLADVTRIVTAEESAGWFLDSSHLTSLYPTMLQTVCRASEGARRLALARLEDRVRRQGEATQVFEQQGRQMTDEVEEALSAQRQRDLLRKAVEGAALDCPFWVTPQGGYDGRQTYRNRFFVSFESGGLAQLRYTQGRWTYGGGGGGRLLAGYNLGGRVSVLGGAEFVGGAMLRPDAGGRSEFVINYLPAIPVLVRWHGVAWHYDLEAGAVSMFQADNGRLSFGGRIGMAVGVSALRTRFFIPWAGAGLAYEHYFEGGGRATQEFIRVGLRVGAVWDP